MTGPCNGTCGRYRDPEMGSRRNRGEPILIEGVCRCRTCGVFLKWDGVFCPCCNCRVSRRPRNTGPAQMGLYRAAHPPRRVP